MWVVHYTDREEPFLLESSGGSRYALVTDPTGSLRFVVDEHGKRNFAGSTHMCCGLGTIAERTSYSPFGKALASSPQHRIPVGYLGYIHDFDTDVVFVKDTVAGPTRPLDCTIGRFMSTTPSIAAQVVDVFRPQEAADAFGFDHGLKPHDIPSGVRGLKA